MYLFGTIHIGDDRTAFLPQKIYDAFDSADALAVEFDDDAFEETLAQDEALQEMVAKSYYYTDGTTVSNHIDSDLYKAATVLMKVAGEYSELSDSLKAWVWGNVIDGFYLAQGRKFTSSKGVDNRLMERAREQEKQILNVESAQMQLELMSECSDEVQQLLLAQSVACSRNENLRNTYELYERWCRGDEAEIIEHLSYMTEEERDEIDADELAIYDEYHQKMELDRNAAMLEVAKGYLDGEQTVFYAVGLAHLLGDGGLVQALRDAGYTVTRIDTARD